eukprot:1482792-Prymnesium_polylepis.1
MPRAPLLVCLPSGALCRRPSPPSRSASTPRQARASGSNECQSLRRRMCGWSFSLGGKGRLE